MYCSSCGNELANTAKFCEACGKEIQGVKTIEEHNEDMSDSFPENLSKSVRNAGNSVLAIGIISLIFALGFELYYYFEGTNSFVVLIIAIILDSIIYGLLINWGNKLKNDKYDNLEKTYKTINTVIIYTVIVIAVFVLLGSYPGFLVILMFIDLFKAKKQVKENL